MTIADLHRAFEVRLDEGLIRDLRRAADMERAHRQLRPRLADRLRRNDTDGFAEIDRRATREIAAVALAANPVLGFAGQNRPDLHLLDAGGEDRVDMLLENHLARRDDGLAVEIVERLSRGTPENARGKRGDDLAGIDDGAHADAVRRAAIVRRDDRVLRDVDEAAGEITRIRRLQRRVGETFARAVRRVEVLENGEAFLEVRDDRAFDDLA